jgi:hypothetical protein
VEAHPPGTSLKPNGLPVIPLYFENDDESRRTLGKDSKLTFMAPADGSYLVKIRDVRGDHGDEGDGDAFAYTLTIRPRRPDFRVTLAGVDPKLAPGGAREFRVKAERVDGFEGPIRVEIAGLPPGVHASTPVEIEPGQIEALGVIWADPDAPAPTPEQAATSTATASSRIGDRDETRPVNGLGTIAWSEKPPFRIAIVASESASGAGPISGDGATSPLEFEAAPGATIELKVRVERGDFKGQVPFGTQGVGRNLPFGVYVDNLGLNGLLILEDQSERTFFVTADASVAAQNRLFHLQTTAGDGLASPPVRLRIKP